MRLIWRIWPVCTFEAVRKIPKVVSEARAEAHWRDIACYLSNTSGLTEWCVCRGFVKRIRTAAQSGQRDYLFIFWLLHCLVNVVEDLATTISCFPHLVFLLWSTWRQTNRWTHRRIFFFKNNQACQVAHFSLAHEQIAWTEFIPRLRQMRQY